MTAKEAINNLKSQQAEYTTRESTINFGTFYYCHNCGNRMFSISKDKLKYNNCECPKCKKILIYKGGREW